MIPKKLAQASAAAQLRWIRRNQRRIERTAMSDENEPKFSTFKPVAGFTPQGRNLEPGETVAVYADPPTLRGRVVRLLREIEYCAAEECCPQCGWGTYMPKEHAPDCELAAVLKALEGER